MSSREHWLHLLWLVLFAGLLCSTSQAQVPFQQGDVLVAVSDGNILHFSNQGRRRQVIKVSSSPQTGMCFDSNGNLYATNFGTQTMSKIGRDGRMLQQRWGGPFGRNPESCVVDSSGFIYTGEVDGIELIRKHDPGGTQLQTFRAASGDRGVDWIDLAADQCTIYYTSEGAAVKRYDICRDRQLPDLARLEGPCFALRLRTNGELLVACQRRLYRLDQRGAALQQYPIAGEFLFAMNLDPDGRHLWTAGAFSSSVYRVDIETGAGTRQPVFTAGRGVKMPRLGLQLLDGLLSDLLGKADVGGLAIFGEPTAALAAQTATAAPSPRPAVTVPSPTPGVAVSQPTATSTPSPTPTATATPTPTPAATSLPSLTPTQTPTQTQTPTPTPTPIPAATVRLGLIPAAMLEAENGQAAALIDLAAAEFDGQPLLELTSNLDLRGVVLEVATPDGWRALGKRPLVVSWPGKPAALPLRLRAGPCAAGSTAAQPWTITIKAPAPGGRVERKEIPLRVVIPSPPWFRCWWPLLTIGLGLLLLGVLVHGFVSPSRFSSRVGLMLSPEEDINEGFFHPIKAQRGSRSGFYRDARIFLSPDFRISGRATGAIARLHADGRTVRIRALAGARLYRRTSDDTWQPLPMDESPLQFGVLHRDELQTIFFELRNR